MENIKQADEQTRVEETTPTPSAAQKRDWVKPEIEEVSEQVMAQPYIRFT